MQGGTGPYTYNWQPGNMTTPNVGGLCAGTYTVIGMDAVGCIQTSTVVVTQPTQINVSVTGNAASCSTCCDGTAAGTASGGTPSYTYMWTGPNSFTAFVPSITALCPGTYTFCVTDANGCTQCSSYAVTFPTGMKDPNAMGNLSVYPSPATHLVTVEETFANPTVVEIAVCNLLGETVFAKTSESKTQLHETIDVAELPNGIYFITVKTAFGNSIQRFVKE